MDQFRGVKRLHDRDRTGWWVLLQGILLVAAVILIAMAIALPEEQKTAGFVVAGIVGTAAFAISLWLFIDRFPQGNARP